MKPQIVSLVCTLKNSTGRLISTSYSRDVMTESLDPSNRDLSVLSKHLKNLRRGEKRQICLEASDAYGFYDPTLAIEVRRSYFPKGYRIQAGDKIHLIDDHGYARNFRVIETQGDKLFLDANHSLAGQDLIFEFEVIDAREATEQEIQDSAPILPITYLN